MARPAGYYLDRFQSFRADRAMYDQKWQMVSDYILPRRDFSVTQRPNQLRPNRVTWGGAKSLNTRMAAFVLAYLIDYSRPFLLPSVPGTLGASGRGTGLDDPSITYLDGLSWQVFNALMRPKAQMMLRLGSMLQEFCAFGCGVVMTQRRPGFGPWFKAMSTQASWWSESEEGRIDTLYHKLALPRHRVIQRWPAAAAIFDRAQLDAADRKSEQDITEVLLCCEPRPGGRRGAVKVAKPFEWTVVSCEKHAIIDEAGYDSFPFSVFTNARMPGQAYSEGAGCDVLPDVMIINHLQQAIENAASQKAQPPLAMPQRMFGRALDRRPGAMNHYNPNGLGLAKAQEALIKLDMTGDPSFAIQVIKDLKSDVETGYYVDWQNLREAGDMTAEEVNERRDIRLRGMASIVANLELPMTQMGERAMEILGEEGRIAPPPAALSRADVDWEYAGPLKVAQLAGNVKSMLQLINARGLVNEQDPDAAQAVDLEEALRVLQNGLAAPPNTLNSRQRVQAARAVRVQQQQQEQNAARLAQVAGAVKDGAGAIAALHPPGAAPGGPPPVVGGGAPFAPVNPFAQPVAA